MRREERWIAALSALLCVVQCEITLAQEPAADAGTPAAVAPEPEPPATPETTPPTAAEPAPALEVVEQASEPVAESNQAQSGLTDIVVTAQRRSTNLQQTPISITALTSEGLRERSANDVSGVTDSTPNV